MSAGQYLYKRFVLPSHKMVEVRKVEEGQRPECVVREVNDDNELSPGEFNLTLQFLLTQAREVRRV